MSHSSLDFADLAKVRKHFPALERWIYMDVSGRGVLSKEVRASLDTHLDERMLNGADKDKFFALVEHSRSLFAEIINANSQEIALTKNISEGLNMIATAIQWKSGDNIILCAELEHPNNIYPWLNLQRFGVEVRMVSAENHHIPIDKIVSRIDERTRVVTASTVTFAPGFRTNIDLLGDYCHERGVMLLVDAAQSVGILHTDVRSSKIDALVVSTQKGLLGLYGMGFLYCSDAWSHRLHPAYLARFGVDVGDAHEAAMGEYSFKLAKGARRFDLGNYNFAAAAAVNASMQQLLAWNTHHIEKYVVNLAHTLASGFIELGLPVVGGVPGGHLAHIVTVGDMSNSHYGGSDDFLNELYEFLSENRVRLSIRRGVLRFSLHAYNNISDVHEVLQLTKRHLASKGVKR
jgi:cysteine desulfurase/selenocysteine lyase